MTNIKEQVRVAAIYNPQTQTKTQLIDGFVVRQNVFRNLYKAIKEAKMEVPEQHYLIQGRRGMGKTSLLLRLAYEVENDASLNKWLIPIVFNEEEYSIRRLFRFWERIMDLLEEKLPELRFEREERLRLSNQYKDDDSYERALFDWLSTELTRTGKKLLLFIDNFGDMASKLTDQEAHRLRKILQTSADIRIFAASAVVLEAFYQYEHPFYEFFKVHELKGLDTKETRDLLLRLAEHYKKEAVTRIVNEHPGRVEALRRITGGVTRTMVLLFEIFADDDDGSAFKDLEVVLDRATPLYKHRMDDLGDQQQAIVEAIALNWDAMSAKEIGEQTRLETKTISAQLNYLEKNGIVVRKPSKTKNHYYMIAERFFNIWYLMRNGRRGDEKRVLWLVRFFEDWCDDDMLKTRAEQHRVALSKGSFDPEAALFYTQAMTQARGLSYEDRHKLIVTTRQYIIDMAPGMVAEFDSNLEHAFQALEVWYSGDEENAYKRLIYAIGDKMSKDEKNRLQTGKGIPVYTAQLGITFYEFGKLELPKAEQCFEWVEMSNDGRALFEIGYYFGAKNIDIDKAIKWYIKAAEKGEVDAMYNLGFLFKNEKKDYDKAIEWYLNAAQMGHSVAMNNLGVLFHNKKQDYDTAIEWYVKATEKGDIDAMYNLGVIFYNEKKDYNKAIEWYQKAAEKGDIDGINFLIWTCFEQKIEKSKALNWARKLTENIQIGGWRHHTAACAFAWNNQLPESKIQAEKFIQDEALLINCTDDCITYFTLMLAKNEAQWLYELFTSPEVEKVQLKDRFKPIWYAILSTVDHPDFQRMGDELVETVEEILAKAKQMAVDYA